MAVKLEVIGSSPAWPNPGGAHSGYLVRAADLLLDCGPGVLARLREREHGWPRSTRSRSRTSTSTTGATSSPGSGGSFYGPATALPQPELWVPPGAATSSGRLGSDSGARTCSSRAFQVSEYEERMPFEAAGFEVTALPRPPLPLADLRLPGRAATASLAYSGDAGPCEALVELARDADLFVCEATLAPASSTGRRAATWRRRGDRRLRRAGARRLLLTHRPAELPRRPGSRSPTTGSSSTF